MSNTFNAFSPEGVIWLSIGLFLDGMCMLVSLLTIIAGLGIALGLIVDIFCIIIIGAWMYFRSGSRPEVPTRAGTKTEAKTAVREATMEAERTAGRSAGRTLTKIAVKRTGRSIGRRILIRGGIAFLGTLAGAATIILQLIPFWTITVYLELTHS